MTLSPDVLSVLQSCSKDQESYGRLVELFKRHAQPFDAQAYHMQILYRTLLSSLPEVSIMTYGHDLRYHTVDGSESSKTAMGLIGKRLRDVIPLEVWERDEPKLLASLRGETTTSDVEYAGRFYRVYTFPLRNEAKEVVSGALISFEVTELRKAEQERNERERLQTTLRLETELSDLKSALMVRISHEFRTPLAIIQTAAELLERYMERMSPEDRVRRTRQIQSHVRYLAALLSEIGLLVSGRVRRPTMALSFDLVATCREMVDLVRETIGAGRKVNLHTEEETVEIKSDIDLVGLIVRHLLTDAVMRSTAEEGIDVLLQEDDEHVSLTVCCTPLSDDTTDVSMNELFYRHSNEREDAAANELRLVKDAVRILGGTVEVSSNREVGLCFYVILPTVQPTLQEDESDTGMLG